MLSTSLIIMWMQILYKLRSFLSTCSMLNITVFFQIPTLAPPLFFFFSPVIEAYVMGEARDTQNIICHNLWCVMASFLTKTLACHLIFHVIYNINYGLIFLCFFNTNSIKCLLLFFVVVGKSIIDVNSASQNITEIMIYYTRLTWF